MTSWLPVLALAVACFSLGFTLGGVAAKQLDCQQAEVDKPRARP